MFDGVLALLGDSSVPDQLKLAPLMRTSVRSAAVRGLFCVLRSATDNPDGLRMSRCRGPAAICGAPGVLASRPAPTRETDCGSWRLAEPRWLSTDVVLLLVPDERPGRVSLIAALCSVLASSDELDLGTWLPPTLTSPAVERRVSLLLLLLEPEAWLSGVVLCSLEARVPASFVSVLPGVGKYAQCAFSCAKMPALGNQCTLHGVELAKWSTLMQKVTKVGAVHSKGPRNDRKVYLWSQQEVLKSLNGDKGFYATIQDHRKAAGQHIT